MTEDERAMFRRHLRLGPDELPPSRDPFGERQERARAAGAWEAE